MTDTSVTMAVDTALGVGVRTASKVQIHQGAVVHQP